MHCGCWTTTDHLRHIVPDADDRVAHQGRGGFHQPDRERRAEEAQRQQQQRLFHIAFRAGCLALFPRFYDLRDNSYLPLDTALLSALPLYYLVLLGTARLLGCASNLGPKGGVAGLAGGELDRARDLAQVEERGDGHEDREEFPFGLPRRIAY